MRENVVSLAEIRAQRSQAKDATAKPQWGDDIMILAAYCQLVKAEHEAEYARIRFEQKRDGITDAWWRGPEDITERVHENNRKWGLYQGLLTHLAKLPAETREQARVKRVTIGRGWLEPNSCIPKFTTPLRDGCIADDHLFPPSLKLARR